MANDASMIFRIKGDASHVKKELASLGMSASRTVGTIGKGVTGAIKGDFSALSGGISSLAGGLTSLGGPVGMAAGAAIASIGTAASAAAVGVFALTKEAAAYGGKITDLSQRTGLGAEALSAMDLAAKQSGSSIEEVSKAVTRFNKTAGEAALGSEEASKKLEMLGVTPQEAMTDLEGALGKVFKRIKSMPPGVQQTKLAMDAFGKSGVNLIPVINAMDGDLDGFIAKAKELGIVIDDTTAGELDKFDDMLVQLGTQFEGLKRQVGVAFLPLLTEMATELSTFISENKEDIKSIASDFAGFTRAVLSGLKQIVDFVRENEWAWTAIKGLVPIVGAGSAMLNIGRQFNENRPPAPAPPPAAGGGGTIDDLYNQMAAEQKALQERLKALDAYYKMETEQARMNYERILAERLEMLRTGEIDENTFRQSYSEATTNFYNYLREQIRKSTALQLQDENLTAEERRNILKRQQIDIQKTIDDERKAREENRRQIDAINKQIVESDTARVNAQNALAIKGEQARAREVKARTQLLLAQKSISEGEAMKRLYENELRMIDLLISATNKLLNIQGLSREQRQAYEADLSALESERRAVLDEIQTAGIQGGQKQEQQKIENAQALNEILKETRRIEIERADAADAALIKEKELLLEQTTRVSKRKVIEDQIVAIQMAAAQRAFDAIQKELEDEKQKQISKLEGVENYEAQKAAIEALYRQKHLLAEEEFERQKKAIRDKFGGATQQTKTFKDEVQSLWGAVKNAGVQMAQGIGSAVQAWVLYGETGGAMVRKVVAESLAALAQQATVQAIIETAKGFGRLAVGDGAGAAKHFKSAALWGAGAVAAGVAGRVIAGDSFKKESGRESVSGRSTNSGNANQGQAYSSMQEQKVDVNRAASFGSVQSETVLVVKDKSGMFSKLFQVELEKNSKVRQSILRTV